MKVAIITPRYPPNIAGGGEISVQLLAESVDEYSDSIDVEVFSFDGGQETLVNGVTVNRCRSLPHSIKEINNPLAVATLRDKIGHFDVIHSYNMALHPCAGYLSQKYDIGTVATLNSYQYIPKGGLNIGLNIEQKIYNKLSTLSTGKILKFYINKIDKLTALSQPVKEIYESYGIGVGDIEVIPNMVDKQLAKTDQEMGKDHFQICYVGSLQSRKGVKYLIRALSHLPKGVRLTVAGDGPELNALKDLSEHLSLGQRINFLGEVDYEDIHEIYSSSDVFVHPGIWPEPFGRTTIESLQAGTPIITTNIGAPPTINPHSELICEPANSEAIAQKVLLVMQNQEEFIIDKQSVIKKYSPEKVTQRIVDQYQEVSLS